MKQETNNKPSQAVLVIDDEPQIRRLLRVTLEASGYRVFDAATGNEGVVQAAQRKPDVVLLDLGRQTWRDWLSLNESGNGVVYP
jgi:two-component system KDP operon response regulator KdpE